MASIGGNAAQAAVNISSAPTKNMSCSAGVCSPTAKSAVLNVDHLVHLLKSSDVTVVTGNGAVTIEVTSPLAWATASRLTLDANYNVSIKAPVTVAGTGAVTIITNDGGSGGDLLFFPGGKIDFWDLSSSLVINGDSYTLAGDIKSLADDVAANPSGFFALAKDYDASLDGTYYASPIETPFGGTFEGLNNGILNLTILDSLATDTVGLFSYIKQGTARDVRLLNADVHVLASHLADRTAVLAGATWGNLLNITVTGTVADDADQAAVGCLTGELLPSGSMILNAHCSADVRAGFRAFVGGLVGYTDPSTTIIGSSGSGAVTGGECTSAGGLVGYSLDTISQSYATGSVAVGNDDCTNVDSLAGGLLGGLRGYVFDSYATGGKIVGGKKSARGGFVGFLDHGEIHQAYSTGAVPGHGTTGGLAGRVRRSNLTALYWDIDSSGISRACGDSSENRCLGITGLTDTQLKSGLPAGFDPAIWGQSPSINDGYPYLLANPPAN